MNDQELDMFTRVSEEFGRTVLNALTHKQLNDADSLRKKYEHFPYVDLAIIVGFMIAVNGVECSFVEQINQRDSSLAKTMVREAVEKLENSLRMRKPKAGKSPWSR